MNVAIDLPDDIVQQLAMKWPEAPRGVMEAITVEGYRSSALTHGQVERLLTLSWAEIEVFLKERQAFLHYDEADLDQDRATLDRLWPK